MEVEYPTGFCSFQVDIVSGENCGSGGDMQKKVVVDYGVSHYSNLRKHCFSGATSVEQLRTESDLLRHLLGIPYHRPSFYVLYREILSSPRPPDRRCHLHRHHCYHPVSCRELRILSSLRGQSYHGSWRGVHSPFKQRHHRKLVSQFRKEHCSSSFHHWKSNCFCRRTSSRGCVVCF